VKRLATLALVLGATVFAPATADAAVRDCGSFNGLEWITESLEGAGISDVKAKNTSCTTARRVTLRAFTTYRGGKRWKYGNWSCKILRQEYEYTMARCTRSGGRVVRWETGA
jgi:hypothetical protein